MSFNISPISFSKDPMPVRRSLILHRRTLSLCEVSVNNCGKFLALSAMRFALCEVLNESSLSRP